MSKPPFGLMPIAALMLVVSGSSVMADPGRWSAQRHDEDWGKFCTASYTSAEGIEIGFHGSPGGEIAAYLDLQREAYPDQMDTRWHVDDGTSYHLHGGVSDYFGYPELEVPDSGLLSDVTGGAMLTVVVEGCGQFRVPLSGSSAAMQALRACLSH